MKLFLKDFLLTVLSVGVCCDCVLANTLSPPPQAIAKLVGDEIIKNKEVFLVWNYGGALVVDGLWKANVTFGFDYAQEIDVLLDHFLNETFSQAYKAVHNLPIPHGSTIGDNTGLFPVNYLNRALSYSNGPAKQQGYSNITDMKVANYIAENYVLNWPVRLSDGCVSRDHGWSGQTGNGTFLWGDDQYMGLTLASRLAVATHNSDYAKFAAQQAYTSTSNISQAPNRSTRFMGKWGDCYFNMLFEEHMRDKEDGLYYHGYNDQDREESCCKWGRANGWGLFSHVEVMASVESFPNLGKEAEQVKDVLQRHLSAIMPFQSEDGRWRQLVNDTTSFLETSCTAMFTSAIARSIIHGWIDPQYHDAYIKAAQKGYEGLVKTVNANGTVSGVCSGTGIQTNAEAYRTRPTSYLASGPGGLGSVLTAAVDMHNLQTYLFNL